MSSVSLSQGKAFVGAHILSLNQQKLHFQAQVNSFF